jgi:hypothetical protein
MFPASICTLDFIHPQRTTDSFQGFLTSLSAPFIPILDYTSHSPIRPTSPPPTISITPFVVGILNQRQACVFFVFLCIIWLSRFPSC